MVLTGFIKSQTKLLWNRNRSRQKLTCATQRVRAVRAVAWEGWRETMRLTAWQARAVARCRRCRVRGPPPRIVQQEVPQHTVY
jgi:hypothetical protein